jgi:hypothetical protein
MHGRGMQGLQHAPSIAVCQLLLLLRRSHGGCCSAAVQVPDTVAAPCGQLCLRLELVSQARNRLC